VSPFISTEVDFSNDSSKEVPVDIIEVKSVPEDSPMKISITVNNNKLNVFVFYTYLYVNNYVITLTMIIRVQRYANDFVTAPLFIS
jgi:hypothetical protein